MPSPSLLVPRWPPSVPRTSPPSPFLRVPPRSCALSLLSWLRSACTTWNCPSHWQLQLIINGEVVNERNRNFPLDPTPSVGSMPVDMVTSRTFLLIIPKGLLLMQNDTHLESHSWLHCASEFRTADDLAIVWSYHLIVTPIDVVISDAILAISFYDVVKILACRYV